MLDNPRLSKMRPKNSLVFTSPADYAALSKCYETYFRRFLSFIEAEIRPYKKIYDIGCGDGSFTNTLSEIFPNSNVIGYDPSVEYIDFASLYYKNKNLQFISKEFDPEILQRSKPGSLFCMKWSAHLMPSLEQLLPLSPKRRLLVIERTPRSFETYPNPKAANSRIEKYMRERVVDALEKSSGARFDQVTFGSTIKLPTSVYVDYVKSRQASYLSEVPNNEIDEFIKSIESQPELDIFEENTVSFFP